MLGNLILKQTLSFGISEESNRYVPEKLMQFISLEIKNKKNSHGNKFLENFFRERL